MIRAAPVTDRDLEQQEVGGTDRNSLMSHQDAELAHQDSLGQLGQIEGRGVAASPTPEPGGDRNHGVTVSCWYFRGVTTSPRFGVGDGSGG
jgi:hypothetical protein